MIEIILAACALLAFCVAAGMFYQVWENLKELEKSIINLHRGLADLGAAVDEVESSFAEVGIQLDAVRWNTQEISPELCSLTNEADWLSDRVLDIHDALASKGLIDSTEIEHHMREIHGEPLSHTVPTPEDGPIEDSMIPEGISPHVP